MPYINAGRVLMRPGIGIAGSREKGDKKNSRDDSFHENLPEIRFNNLPRREYFFACGQGTVFAVQREEVHARESVSLAESDRLTSSIEAPTPVRTILPLGKKRAYRMNFSFCKRITGVNCDAAVAAITSSTHPFSHGHHVMSSSPQFGHAWKPLWF